MAQQINPPQFDETDSDEVRLYKHRQFVEDVIRAIQQLNTEIGGGGGGGDGYPAQLGYMGVR